MAKEKNPNPNPQPPQPQPGKSKPDDFHKRDRAIDHDPGKGEGQHRIEPERDWDQGPPQE